jgi:hypothetical protein
MGMRPVTTIAPQALMALNDSFVHAQADALSTRLAREAGDGAEARIRRGFRLVLQREPTQDERFAAESFLIEQRARIAQEGGRDPAAAAWRSLCLSLLNLNETLYVD